MASSTIINLLHQHVLTELLLIITIVMSCHMISDIVFSKNHGILKFNL